MSGYFLYNMAGFPLSKKMPTPYTKVQDNPWKQDLEREAKKCWTTVTHKTHFVQKSRLLECKRGLVNMGFTNWASNMPRNGHKSSLSSLVLFGKKIKMGGYQRWGRTIQRLWVKHRRIKAVRFLTKDGGANKMSDFWQKQVSHEATAGLERFFFFIFSIPCMSR